MLDRLPDRLFHPLDDIAEYWRVTQSDLRQWLTEGHMTAVLWLPMMSVIESVEVQDHNESPDALRHWEGYVRLSGHQCGRIFRQGRIMVRDFTTLDTTRNFRLPESVDDLTITVEKIVVLEAERKRMEARYPSLSGDAAHFMNTPPAVSNSVPDPTYRIVNVNGCENRFGETQAMVLRLLAEAAQAGQPWQSGKDLLRRAGSQSFSLSNLFKRRPVWRKLVLSNNRGLYRLHESFVDAIPNGIHPGIRCSASGRGQ